MNALRALIERASAEAGAGFTAAVAPPGTPEAEVARVMGICNACRYCEGFCAVFPAMTRRLAFDAADAHYLANLCHNCGACLHACQYAPPHDFGVNVPRAMAQVRLNTYTAYAWPAALGGLYRRAGLTLALALALGLALMLAAAVVQHRGWAALAAPMPSGDFYALFPHGTLVALFAPVFLWAVLALGIGVWRFWRGQAVGLGASPWGQAPGAAAAEAARDALTLRHLGGGHGEGCTNEDDRWTLARRRAHHLSFWGFMLCFAATSVATVYHYAFGWVAPYDWPSVPKLLGGAGGAMLLLGSVALGVLHLRRDPMHGDPRQRPMDLGFIALLGLAALTGLGLWAARGHAGQAAWLVAHLAVVMALFLTLPYGKFAHGLYRSAALLKHAIERRQPDRLRLGGE